MEKCLEGFWEFARIAVSPWNPSVEVLNQKTFWHINENSDHLFSYKSKETLFAMRTKHELKGGFVSLERGEQMSFGRKLRVSRKWP